MLKTQQQGQGYPIVLVHGWGVTFSLWEKIAPLLAKQFCVIIIELPGHHQSAAAPRNKSYYQYAADQLEQTRQGLGIDKWGIVAYSVGSRVAECYANKYPQSLTAIVFINPLYFKREIGQIAKAVKAMDKTFPAAMDWLISGPRLKTLVRLLGFSWGKSQYIQPWAVEIDQQDKQLLKQMIHDLPGNGRTPFELPDKPTLFVLGDIDAMVDKNQKTQTPNVKRLLVHGSHGAPLENAQEIADATQNFLQKHIQPIS